MTTSQIARIIRNRQAQGFSPRAVAYQVQLALKKEQAMNEHLCKDCQRPMETIQQGQHTVVTCKRKECTLYGVTLSTDQYAGLTDIQLEGYRKMVQQFRERNHETN